MESCIYNDSESFSTYTVLLHKLLTVTQTSMCDRKSLQGFLKNINEIDYEQSVISDVNATLLLVNQMCSIIQPTEESLVMECSKFLIHLMKQGVTFQDRTFTTCKRWVLENLEFCDSAALLNTISVLEALFTTCQFHNISQDLGRLLSGKSILLKHIYPLSQRWNEEQYLALNCLSAILKSNEQNENSVAAEYLQTIKTVVLKILQNISKENLDKSYFNKTVTLCLKILHRIFAKNKKIDETDNLGELLGLIQAYLFYGIEGYINIVPSILHPSAMSLPEIVHPAQSKKYFRNHKTKSKRQSSNKVALENENSLPIQIFVDHSKHSSDSEMSDNEVKNLTLPESAIRIQSINLLSTLVECTSNREFFIYWTQVISSGSKDDTRVLTKCILREPLSKIRQLALATFHDLLLGARLFFSHAEDTEKMSFVTYFGMLGSIIKEMHYTLSLLLSTERNVIVLTQALKCANALAKGTPYSRLKPGLATKLVRHCRNHLLHRDPTVRVAALSVFEALALSDPLTSEIFNILAKSSNFEIDTEFSDPYFFSLKKIETEEVVNDDFDEDVEQVNFCEEENIQETVSALVRICFKNLSNDTVNEPVKLQSLKLLGTLAFNARDLIFSHLEIITNNLISLISEQEPQVAFHACRVIEIIAARLTHSKCDNSSAFWNLAFSPVISLVQHSSPMLREVACDCLGNIDANMFAQLSRDKEIMIITVLFGAVQDNESAVRAASLRSLGLLVTLPTLEEDAGFLMDLIDVTCKALQDENLGVRIKAAWAMASLCDGLVKRENNSEVEQISLKTVLPKLYNSSVKAGQDHEKVKCNAVRSIGNIIYLCKDKLTLQNTTHGLDALIDCAINGKDMKVRWNACRAIGIIMSRNPDEILPLLWKDKVFPVLCDLVCNSPNFKVRTHAAWAISTSHTYDKHIINVWKSIIVGLENSEHVPNHVEYAHRDTLVQQLCLTLCHLAVHTDTSELESLWRQIKDHFDDMARHMKRFQEQILPEKAKDLQKAKNQFFLFFHKAQKPNEKMIATKLIELFKKEENDGSVDTQ